MKILHVIKSLGDQRAFEIASLQQELGNEVAVLLIHDAVLGRTPKGIKAFACCDDLKARGVETTAEPVDYTGIIHLIFRYDKVTCW